MSGVDRFGRTLNFGATVEGNETRFKLWAPGAESVDLMIAGRAPQPMAPSDGWWSGTADVAPGTEYLFRLADGTSVPDPASRAQHGDVHGRSVVIDPRSYRWQHADWPGRPWEEVVLYELHPGLMGGYAGVADHLPKLKALGVTAVELMPIADFPGRRNWGYDGVLPFAPDGAYGTPNDLKRLIDRAHELEMMMFLDVVYNHFGPDGNYLAAYAPQFFRNDIATPWGAAIDFRRPEVRQYFTDNVLYWLMEYRFDGLRFDAVHAITEPDWLDEMAATVRRTVEPGRHVHLVLEHDGNIASHLAGDFDAQWNDDAHHVLHVLMTGETGGYYADYSDAPAVKLARALAEGFIYQGEPSAHRAGEKRGTPSGMLPPSAFVFFLQNHDQIGNRAFGERLTTLANAEALKAAVALQLLTPQIPLIFMGEEYGSEAPFFFFTDHNPELAEAVREGRRREFAAFAAFANAGVDALPDPNAIDTFERSRPIAPDKGQGEQTFAFYRSLLELRRRYVVPGIRGARSTGAQALGDAAVIASWDLGTGQRLTIACNLGAGPVSVAPVTGDVVFASDPDITAEVAAGRLPPRATFAALGPAGAVGR
ncbi:MULTISPECIES: malto-oligosyltrehalose trehalohydrolase [unclassified Chelatococcus]|uniref:malto-oligosyltrehalose trehalohydrolase n=1 Tax=unclassified Chelatococcus TaxID=2638111 RepID=UPI001BCAE804|nr:MULTISPECIES: malto-oligosyltrehalose trehalohydrolase [unclassified Chelatococcus]CAH1654015.1 Malto-oligosyltrehalose trehalohydrolase [Hyphomicrobiales bacterium]MBS7742837.1 malto-oligosyltrehalose trehalohydrolase [Chelatococcus sp. HY11]MBX3542045.1 malto-oligosyltrehalose trehalohydrolase [Chelatococcus sp.]MCO5074063.1 malto-oligosyltrehalose trehalohydrolase [Chelatococcus sp.]CAH1694730.1 Malto-oligosyltrehalose trehalohydrolase [Hyphomicrobiales bacterium]